MLAICRITQCNHSFLFLDLFLCEVFGSVPCTTAAKQHFLRKAEHYSFTFLFHISPGKQDPFQSLIHYSNLLAAGAASVIQILWGFLVSMQKKSVVILVIELYLRESGHLVKKDINGEVCTQFLGLSVSVVLQLAEEGVLLGQQNFDVLHTHSNYPGANIWLKSVDTLVGQSGGLQ